MIIRINRKNIGHILVYIMYLLPYIEISIVRNIFEYTENNLYIPAAVPIMTAIYLFSALRNRLNHTSHFEWYRPISRVITYFWIYVISCAAVLLFHGAPLNGLVQLWEFAISFLYAKEMLAYILSLGVSHRDITKKGTIFFVITQMFFLLINIIVYGFSFDGNSESRILSTGGGPVILGYTVALVVACWICMKGTVSKILNVIVLGLLVLISLATGSRGSMWPIIVVLFFYLGSQKGRISPVKLYFLAIAVFCLFALPSVREIAPRLFDNSDGGRISSVINNLKVFSGFTVGEILLGKGLGQFFPYQLWMTNRAAFTTYNTFFYSGQRLLVQPHNAFIYTLMESGLIGLTLFCMLLYTLLVPRHQTIAPRRRIEASLFLIVVLAVFFFESTAFVAPGSASLWWFILLLFATREFAEDKALARTE